MKKSQAKVVPLLLKHNALERENSRRRKYTAMYLATCAKDATMLAYLLEYNDDTRKRKRRVRDSIPGVLKKDSCYSDEKKLTGSVDRNLML